MNKIKIFTDGGARGNPGPSAIGVYMEDELQNEIKSIGKRIGVATNNVAEYGAVIEAFRYLSENKEEFTSVEDISFNLDSELVTRQLNGIYKIKNVNLKNLHQEIKDMEKKLGIPVSYSHVPREQNKKADRLVNQALDGII